MINHCDCGNKNPDFLSINDPKCLTTRFKIFCLECYASSKIFDTHKQALDDWNINRTDSSLVNNKNIFEIGLFHLRKIAKMPNDD